LRFLEPKLALRPEFVLRGFVKRGVEENFQTLKEPVRVKLAWIATRTSVPEAFFGLEFILIARSAPPARSSPRDSDHRLADLDSRNVSACTIETRVLVRNSIPNFKYQERLREIKA